MFRKLLVTTILGAVLVIAGLPAITATLDHVGVIPLARAVRADYLTGTALAVIIALVILLPSTCYVRVGPYASRCPVCGQVLRQRGRYCSACGSRIEA